MENGTPPPLGGTSPLRGGSSPHPLACLLLTGADIAPLTRWTVPRFPLTGGQIVARGVKAGPDVARVLREVEDRWVAEGFPGDERIGEILGDELAN